MPNWTWTRLEQAPTVAPDRPQASVCAWAGPLPDGGRASNSTARRRRCLTPQTEQPSPQDPLEAAGCPRGWARGGCPSPRTMLSEYPISLRRREMQIRLNSTLNLPRRWAWSSFSPASGCLSTYWRSSWEGKSTTRATQTGRHAILPASQVSSPGGGPWASRSPSWAAPSSPMCAGSAQSGAPGGPIPHRCGRCADTVPGGRGPR